jgi:hypothetical protein
MGEGDKFGTRESTCPVLLTAVVYAACPAVAAQVAPWAPQRGAVGPTALHQVQEEPLRLLTVRTGRVNTRSSTADSR